jgi:hypothetical protein
MSCTQTYRDKLQPSLVSCSDSYFSFSFCLGPNQIHNRTSPSLISVLRVSISHISLFSYSFQDHNIPLISTTTPWSPLSQLHQHGHQHACSLRSSCAVVSDRSCYSCLRPPGRQVSITISCKVTQISRSANSQQGNSPSDVKSICVNGSTVEQTLVSDCGNDYDAAMSAFSSICAGVSVTIGKFCLRIFKDHLLIGESPLDHYLFGRHPGNLQRSRYRRRFYHPRQHYQWCRVQLRFDFGLCFRFWH